MKAFKEQARAALRALRDATPPSPHKSRSYIVPAPNPVEVGRIRQAEEEILWAEHGVDADLGFMHNDFTESNIIVDDGKIVGLVDWEMAGWFGWATTGLVHRQIRDIPEESFAHLERTEAIDKMLFWNDLYEV